MGDSVLDPAMHRRWKRINDRKPARGAELVTTAESPRGSNGLTNTAQPEAGGHQFCEAVNVSS